MLRAHAGAGHKSHLPLGSARAPEAQNNADSDTNELVLFSAGKRAEEKGGPGRLRGLTALFLGLQLLCTCAGQGGGWGTCCPWDICIPGNLAPARVPSEPCLAGATAMLSTHGHLGVAGEAGTGLSSSVSLPHLPSGSCGCEWPQRWIGHI